MSYIFQSPGFPPRIPLVRAGALTLLLTALARPVLGDVTYTLNLGNSPEEQQVAASVATAAELCNTYASFNKHWNVFYNAGIPTAEGNYDGYMGYGSQRSVRVALHEGAHTFGMGTGPNYHNLIAGGVWKGQYGNQAQFDTFNSYADGLHGDGHAVWPGGFNYENEDGFIERIWMIRIQAAIRADMGIMSYTREARNAAVVAGETAVFRVESPMAYAWQWHKDGVALANGGDISGATTSTLRIANADAADAGSYHCAATGAGETLNSRARQLWVHAAPALGQWNFEGNANDSLNGHHGTTFGSPGYTAGKIGQAIDLDGSDDYIDLPDPLGRTRDLTVATWVRWDGGNDWQRVFDFGTGTYQYLFLTPKAGGGAMRLALKDAINGKNSEYQINVPTLATGQWVHLAAVLRGSYMTLYVNGKAAGSAFGIQSSPADFPATNNYIGKSQYPDPLFNGRIDDFRIFGKALDGPEIWSLWGQSANQAPVFTSGEITLPAASFLTPYTGETLAAFASDADSDPLTFTKLDGPAWLSVAADGTLSGQPGAGANGENTFVVRASDPSGASSDAILRIEAFAPEAAPVSSSLAAPVPDGGDAYYLAGNLGEPDTIGGTGNSGDNDESTYLAEDRSGKGQTFTTGSNPQGYFLKAFTFQHVNWPALTAGGTYYDIQPGDRWEIEIGTMDGSGKTPILKYTAAYDGPAISGGGDSGTGRYLTFNLSGLGLQLGPDTTCYFAAAPLSGDPFLELNSSRNGSYAGGTAFRGDSAGTIGSSVIPLAGDYIFHADLVAKGTPAAAGTIAHWNFEEGTANTDVPYSRTGAGRYDGSITDLSGRANHLSAWSGNWHGYRTEVPAATTPQTGVPNTLSLRNSNSFPAVSAIGTSLTTWSPEEWTIEAAIRPDDATNGFQTFLGRDSQGAHAADPALAAMYFTIAPNGGLRFMFTDAAGNLWDILTAADTLEDGKWYAVAATSDSETLALYAKNLSDGDAQYTLMGTLDISASANPAISTGTGNGGDWDAGVFTVARGLYNGGHTDRFFGHIDDIRLSEVALAPADFLYSPAAAGAPDFANWIAGYPDVGPADDFNDDPDRDGLANGVENYLGTRPDAANPGLQGVVANAGTLTFRHSRNPEPASDISARYRWSLDLETWNESGQSRNGTTVTFTAARDTPAPGTTTVTATIVGGSPSGMFFDLQVTKP